MNDSGIRAPDTFAPVMVLQLFALAIALAGLYFLELDISLSGSLGVSSIGIGIAGALLSYAVAHWLTRSNSGVGRTLRRHCADLHLLFARYSGAQIILVSLAAGVCEELLFRGLLQTWLSQLTTPFWGLLGASVAFALLHYASFTYFVVTLAIGLLLGAVYQWSGSILCVVTWHALYDLVAIVVLARYPGRLGVPPAIKSEAAAVDR